MLLKVSLWLCLILIGIFIVQGENEGVMKIGLRRQKTSFEQHLNNAKSLEKKGFNFDWLYKKSFMKGEPRTNDSISLKRYLDNEFYAEIVVGHPGQILNVAFDASWSKSWVMSSQCHSWSSIGCLFHNTYDHTKSSEWKKNGTTIVVPSGKDKLSGFYSYDNISIAHSNVTDFLFIEMTEVPRSFLFSKIDGVLGLGLQESDLYEPFFYAMLRQKKIKKPIFSIYLNRDKQSNKGGNIALGFIDYKHVHNKRDANNNTVYDTIIKLPVKAGPFWQFDLDSIFVLSGKQIKFKLCESGKCTAMTDSSSNNILGPQADVDRIHVEIKARPFYMERYTVDCDTINKLPEITFVIGGQNFTLKGRDYTVKMSYLSITHCLSAFVPRQYTDLWVLGGAFLAEYYTTYDIQQKEIGLVKCA